jgi:chaperonin GroEL
MVAELPKDEKGMGAGMGGGGMGGMGGMGDMDM